MKKINCLCLLLLASSIVFSQQTPARILGTFVYNHKLFNYDFSKQASDKFSFTISSPDAEATDQADEDTTQDTFAVKPDFASFGLESFRPFFMNQMKNKFGVDSTEPLKDKATEVFYAISARLDFTDDEPVTAYLILKKDIITSFLKSNTSVYYNGPLSLFYTRHSIERVNVETEDGAIKNITVHLVDTTAAKKNIQSPRQYLEFKNQYPISISGKFDPEKFENVNLYCYSCNGIKGLTRYIKLSDLLILDIVLENNKEDYSPSNRTVALNSGNPIVELKKEKRSRILEVAAFTDFVGIDQEEPNGLIQIEAKRKININTKSHLLFSSNSQADNPFKMDLGKIHRYERLDMNKNNSLYALQFKNPEKKYPSLPKMDSTDKIKLRNGTAPPSLTDTLTERGWKMFIIPFSNRRFHSPYYTFFGSIEPRLLFSKLEKNNRVIDTANVKNSKVDPLQLYQYQVVSFGVMANLLKFNFPQLKLNWNVLNTGYYWFRTRIGSSTDSSGDNSVPLNNSYWQFGTHINFQPDSRWGASMGVDYIKERLWNKTFDLSSSHGLLQLAFDAFLKTSDNGKLFFRYRWTNEHHNRKNNFTQIQLGYSLNLFTGNSDEKKN